MIALAGCHLMLAQAVPPAAAERLTLIQPAQLTRLKARLDPKLISPTARILYTEPKQSFRLLRGEGEINLVSIVFQDPHPGQGSSIGGCGVYLIPPNGLIQFFNPLDGQGETPYGCADIVAVRLHRIPGGKPVFEFTADMSAGAHSFLQTFTVRWDPRVGRYTMDTVDFKQGSV
jgi:hypothetical protein